MPYGGRENEESVMFLEIVLNILSVLAIIVFGAFLVVVVADLILCIFDDPLHLIVSEVLSEDWY